MSDPVPKEVSPQVTSRLMVASAGLMLGAMMVVLVAAGGWHRARESLAPILRKVEGLDVISAEHAQLVHELEAITATVGDPEKLVGSRAASNQLRITASLSGKARRAVWTGPGRSDPYFWGRPKFLAFLRG